MNVFTEALAIGWLVSMTVLIYFVRQSWRGGAQNSKRIDDALNQFQNWQRDQGNANEEFRRSVRELHGSIEPAVSRVRAEWATAHNALITGTAAANRDMVDRLDTQIRAINALGELCDERAESAKESAVDIDMRFKNIEQALKMKTVELGDKRQSRSRPWSDVRAAAMAGAAKGREREAENQNEE